jgi:hypothetical protein
MRILQSLSYSRITEHFIEQHGSLLCAQEPHTGAYPEPDESSLYHPILFSKIHPNIILPPKYNPYNTIVGIATSYGLDDRGVGVRVPVGSRIFSSPCRQDRLWGPPNLSNS